MKAILVIDLPENCGKCRLADFGECRGSKSYIHMPIKGRPKECPLRPLPQRKLEWNWGSDARGWNACIDEILGETE